MARATRRPGGTPFIVSIVLHVVLGAGLVQVLLVPGSWRWQSERTPAPEPERIRFVTFPSHGTTTPGRDGGDDRPASKTPHVARALVAPTSVASSLPPVAPATPGDDGGSGPRIGAGGATAGIRASYSDPRVWAPAEAATAMSPSLTPAEQLDQSLKADVQRHNDSLATYAHVPSKLERGDWTVGGPGGKWGVEPGKIRLGKFSLPSAVLALLPLNMQGGNSAAGGRDLIQERAMAAIRRDILFQSQRMLNEEELRVAAKRIRERVDRERRDKAAREQAPRPATQGELQP